MSFGEFLIFKEKNYSLKRENSKIINDELVVLAGEYIKFGGYPRIVLESSEEKKQTYLFQIINTYVRKDIRDVGNIRNIALFNNLLEVLASQTGQLLNISELSSTLGLSRVTVVEYLDLLERTFIIKLVRPFHKNLRNELSKNPKVFFMDTGIAHLLWLKEFPKAIFGNIFETFIFLELMRTGRKINFWRTTNRQEVDFVISDKRLYAVEAKLNFNQPNKKHLHFFSEKYECQTHTIGLIGEKNGKYVWEFVKELEAVG